MIEELKALVWIMGEEIQQGLQAAKTNEKEAARLQGIAQARNSLQAIIEAHGPKYQVGDRLSYRVELGKLLLEDKVGEGVVAYIRKYTTIRANSEKTAIAYMMTDGSLINESDITGKVEDDD